ncbi:MAG: cytochrome-c peroxidase [Campylobacterota bacterium]|nr:cytochrome-c peroxidase [Campylobacterota bacterium]
MKIVTIFLLLLPILYAEPISPIPKKIHVNTKKADLGKLLFFETLLSKDNTISCASCHDLNNGGDDGLKFSFGVDGKEGDINSPTVYNAVFNFRQFWNGRARDLAQQAEGPVENPVEMGHDFKILVPILKSSHYNKKFSKIYSDGITKKNIVDAIAEFEKTLITPNAPFDNYLQGDDSAITQQQKEGYEIFKSKGCIACHHGINIGGNLYNKFGVMRDAESKRLGRYEVTKKERDKYYFKVPSLRNIEHTAPYLHDGRFEKLEDVVKFMAHYQLGRTITDEEVVKVVRFLHALTGEIPASLK